MRRRSKHVTIRVSDDELDMLAAIAKHQGLSSSDVMRQYIRRSFRKLFGNAEPPPRT